MTDNSSPPPFPRGPEGRVTIQFSLPSALQALRHHARWVGWKWQPKPNGGWDKPLYRADYTDFHASTQKPKTWVPLDAAERALAAGQLDGIGYVVRDDEIHVFIDLDDCRNPDTGELLAWADELVEACNSYTEITPSGRGIRIIGTHGGFLHAPIHTPYKLPEGGHGEVFFRAARYVTVTGIHLPGAATAMSDISGPVLDLLAKAGRQTAIKTHEGPGKTREEAHAPLPDVLAALSVIPNHDVEYDDWVRVGLATYAATGGAGEGLEAFQRWSCKSQKHEDHECLRVWRSFHKSPPRKIGFGSLYYLARTSSPFFVAPTWRGREVASAPTLEHDPETGEIIEPAKPTPQPQQARSRALKIMTLAEVEAMPPAVWLVEGLVPSRALVIPWGPPKVGKTFVWLSLSLHIAAGIPWADRAVVQGAVVYLAGEGLGGFPTRLKAMRHQYGIGADIPFYVIPRAVNFRDPAAVAEVIEVVRATVPEGMAIAMVVIDTLARAMPGVDENSAQEVGSVIAQCDEIKEELNCTVAPIHHSGKDVERGMRGSSAIHGAVDATYAIKAAGPHHVRLINEDQKDGEPAPPMTFKMEQIDPGFGRKSLVPIYEPHKTGQPGRPVDPNAPPPEEWLARVMIAMDDHAELPLGRVAEALGLSRGRQTEDLKSLIPLGRENAVVLPAARKMLWKRIKGEHKTAPIFIHIEDLNNDQ